MQQRTSEYQAKKQKMVEQKVNLNQELADLRQGRLRTARASAAWGVFHSCPEEFSNGKFPGC